jgi:alpha-beta hydrolase superfamily lysophospholipase
MSSGSSGPPASLLEKEETSWREIHDLVESLSESEQTTAGYFREGWSVKDLLGHLGSWLAEAGIALERIHGGTYRTGELDIDAKNEEFLQTIRRLSPRDTRALAEAARARMLRSLKALPTITPEARTWIEKGGVDHYEEHLPRLREWVSELRTRADPGEGMFGGEEPESRFIRASDGVDLHLLTWTSPSARPWCVLVFLHGIASHAAWFGETATELKRSGVAVYAPDRRGSGRSGGPRGHLARFERGIADVDEVLALAASEHEGLAVFVAASSWAAKLALVHAVRRPALLSGLMLLGPGLFPRVDLSVPRRVQVLIGHLVAPRAYIPIPLTPELYTTTPHFLDLIRQDPLRLLTATTRTFWETGRLDRRRRAASARLGLPLLVLQGEGDAMMDVPRTSRWLSELDTADKTYVGYPGAGHTLDFELDRAPYVADILGWLRARAAGPPTRGS